VSEAGEFLREDLVSVGPRGGRIHGMLHLPPAGSDPVPAALILHGFTGSSTSDNRLLVRLARHLAGHGIGALRFDFRGSGQSEGEFAEMTLGGEVADAALLLEWLAARPEIDSRRLGVIGFSVGGAIARCLLAISADIRAAVLLAPVAHPLEVLVRGATAEQLAGQARGGLIDARGEGLGPAFVAELPTIRPLDLKDGAGTPLRVIHGTADPTVPFSEGEAYYRAATGPRSLVPIEEADHGFYAIPWREQLLAASTEWLAQHL